MANRSYVPRHAVVSGPLAPGARKAATVFAASVGVAAATTALANPASAQTHHGAGGVWDRVASCESGQRWHVDTGNGYYGGLQFSSGTWHAYHGGKYASHADNATRMEQIQVARRVLKSQGRNAWPVCGPRAGLTKNSGDATGASLPNDPSQLPSDGSHKTHSTKKHHKKSVHKKSHHVTHKSRTHHNHTYVVKRGDTLSGIARKEHVSGGWHALYRANRSHLHNPNVLHVGQHLLIP